VQNIYKTLSDFFLKTIPRRNKKKPSAGATALTEGIFHYITEFHDKFNPNV